MEIVGCADWSAASGRVALTEIVDPSEMRDLVGDGRLAALAAIQRAEDATRDDGLNAIGRLGPISIVADARIDNLDDIRGQVAGEREEGVCQLLIRAYMKWGDLFPDRLVGDFALVLWDERQQRLLAARDPFGVRPLFHTAAGSRLWLGSRTARLRRTFSVTPKLDDQMIVEHLLWRPKSLDGTILADVKELRVGHVLVATARDVKVVRYWFPPVPRSEIANRTKESIFEELRFLFSQSVQRRTRSSRPVVLHVSGGLDSSSIAMAADGLLRSDRHGTPKLVGASAIYPGLPCDEGPFIDAVAREVHFSIERWDGTRSDPVDLTDPSLDAPGSRMTTTSGCDGDVKIARTHGAGVILAGIGGDDLMMTIGFTKDLLTRGAWREAAAAMWPSGTPLGVGLKRLKSVAGHFLPASVRRLRSKLAADVPDWLSPRFRSLARELAADDASDLQFTSQVRRNSWMHLSAAQGRRSIGAMQRKAALLSLEYRYPFLDRELVEFVFSIPPSCLPGPVKYARVHREAFRSILPPEVANRGTKAELTPALVHRVRTALPLIDDLLDRGRWASQQYVDRPAARQFTRAVTSRGSHPTTRDWWQVWRIATLEAWMRAGSGYTPRD